jgi:cobalt/nickel transport system permease protein
MSFHHLDQYAHVESPMTSTPPVVRLLATVTLALGVSTLPLGAWIQTGVFAAVVVLVAAAARVPAGVMLIRVAGPLGFVVLASVALLFLVPGETVFRLGPLRVSDAGLLRFGSAMSRSAVALGAAVLLVSTTSFPDLVHALRQLRLPRAVTTSLGLAYRLLYILSDEIERIERAARSRSARPVSGRRRKLLVGITAAALTRSLARGERTYRAMLARGYRGEMRSLHSKPVDVRSALLLMALIVIAAATTLSAYGIGG